MADRLIANVVPADHFVHHFTLAAHRDGCSYYECRHGCGTRKVIVMAGKGLPDTSWLRTGRFRVDEVIERCTEVHA